MKKPTIAEILELVSFGRDYEGDLYVIDVKGDVKGSVVGRVCGDVKGSVDGNVEGNVCGDVWGDVRGNVCIDVWGDVKGNVEGKIAGLEWQFVETPKEKLIRLIREGRGEEVIDMLEEEIKRSPAIAKAKGEE